MASGESFFFSGEECGETSTTSTDEYAYITYRKSTIGHNLLRVETNAAVATRPFLFGQRKSFDIIIGPQKNKEKYKLFPWRVERAFRSCGLLVDAGKHRHNDRAYVGTTIEQLPAQPSAR